MTGDYIVVALSGRIADPVSCREFAVIRLDPRHITPGVVECVTWSAARAEAIAGALRRVDRRAE